MCIATVYSESPLGDRERVMQDVISLDLANDTVVVTSLLGETKTMKASIKHIDFIKHTVTLISST